MFKKRWTRWLIVGLSIVLLAGGTVGVVSAHGGPGGWFGRGGNRDELLAEELDVTVEELQAAREAAKNAALDQALEEGAITDEQYEQIQTRMALRAYLDPQALMAEALGVDVGELANKPLNEWLEELDLDRETVMDRMQDARDAAFDQAIADGVITEEEADELKDRDCGPRGGFGIRPGGFGGRGRFDTPNGMRRFPGRSLEDGGFQMQRPGSGSGF